MTTRVRATTPRSTLRATIACIALSCVVVVAALLGHAAAVGAILGLLGVLYLFRAAIFTWTSLLVFVTATLMLVPFNRFTLPLPLPIGVQPLIAVILLAAAALCLAALLDPAFTWQRAPLIGAVLAFFGTQIISIVVNIATLSGGPLIWNVTREVLQNSVLVPILFIVVRQLLRSRQSVDLLLMLVVGVGAAIGLTAVLEQATGFNFFYTLSNYLPLSGTEVVTDHSRDGSARAVGPVAHPIELGVMLTLILPIGVYLALHSAWPHGNPSRALLWGSATAAILTGVLASVSRTSIIMIVIMMIVAVALRPRLFVPLVCASAAAITALVVFLPSILQGTLGSLLDVDSLIASQTGAPGLPGSGRLTDIDGSLEKISQNVYFGTGLGSRIVVGSLRNSKILDNQVLTTAEQSGLTGVLGLAILVAVPIWQLVAFVLRRSAPAKYTNLGVALASTISSVAVALVLFDALSFRQASGVFILILAIASWLLAEFPLRTPSVPSFEPTESTTARVEKRSEVTPWSQPISAQ